MTVDPQVVKIRLDAISICIGRLQTIANLTEDEFLSDWTKHDIAEKNLQKTAQSIIDICTHLIAHNHWGTPETYKDAVSLIMQHKVISNELAEKLVDLVKLRNIIVHLYLDIDLHIIYQSAKSIIEDATKFIEVIMKLLT